MLSILILRSLPYPIPSFLLFSTNLLLYVSPQYHDNLHDTNPSMPTTYPPEDTLHLFRIYKLPALFPCVNIRALHLPKSLSFCEGVSNFPQLLSNHIPVYVTYSSPTMLPSRIYFKFRYFYSNHSDARIVQQPVAQFLIQIAFHKAFPNSHYIASYPIFFLTRFSLLNIIKPGNGFCY